MMWFDRFTHHDAAGMPNWEITDVLFLPPMRKNQLLFYVDCLRSNKPDPELVVIADNVVRGGYYARVRHAWRANRQTEKFQQIPVTGIKCEAVRATTDPAGTQYHSSDSNSCQNRER